MCPASATSIPHILIHGEHAERPCGVGTIAGELLSVFPRRDEAVVVEVVLSVAHLAGGQSVAADAEWTALDGYGSRVEAVGAFPVVCIEDGWLVQCAIPHDNAIVIAQYQCAACIDGIGQLAAAHPGIVGEVKIGSSFSRCLCHGAEDAGYGRIHGTGQGDILMDAVVEHEIASLR